MMMPLPPPNIQPQIDLSSPKPVRSSSYKKASNLFGQGRYFDLPSCSFHVAHSSVANNFSKVTWFIRSAADSSSGSDPSSTSNANGGTRLFRTIRNFQAKLGDKIREIRKNLPMKLLFFLVGFYCATAFATVIGQTGDWDILSAALAVVVVEGIGYLMYKGSLPLLSNIRNLITMFNFWKAGLSLGLFLDSFKY